MIKVQDLQPGMQFRLPGQRKFKTVSKVIELKDHDDIEPKGRKILIIFEGCRQNAILKYTQVEINTEFKNVEKPKCTHLKPDGSEAFELYGITHKEIWKCTLCGETTTV